MHVPVPDLRPDERSGCIVVRKLFKHLLEVEWHARAAVPAAVAVDDLVLDAVGVGDVDGLRDDLVGGPDQRAGVEDASQHARERRLVGQEDCDW